MKKRFFGFTVFLLTLALLGQEINISWASEGESVPQTGIPDTKWYTSGQDPYTISTADELAGLAKLVNDNTEDFENKTVYLSANIDISKYGVKNKSFNGGAGWLPIGFGYLEKQDGWAYAVFSGTFDGGGHVITGLSIDATSTDDDEESPYSGLTEHGLFGRLGGTVKNLGVIGTDIKDSPARSKNCDSGSIAGCIESGAAVRDCYASGSVKGKIAGGIAGSVEGRITWDGYSGRFLKDGAAENCRFTGDVTGEFGSGGIAGSLSGGHIYGCFSDAKVRGESYTGGIAGLVSWNRFSDSTVLNCYSAGDIRGGTAGGIAGDLGADCEINACYSTASVSGSHPGGIVGGIGKNTDGTAGTVKNCAALNPFVKTAGGDIGKAAVMNANAAGGYGRVAGYSGGTLANNTAYAGMSGGYGTFVFEGEPAADGIDGKSITAERVKADGTLGGLFKAPVWTCKNGGLPGFGEAAGLPAHLNDAPDEFFSVTASGSINKKVILNFEITENILKKAIADEQAKAELLKRHAGGVYVKLNPLPDTAVMKTEFTLKRSVLAALNKAGVNLVIETPLCYFALEFEDIPQLLNKTAGDIICDLGTLPKSSSLLDEGLGGYFNEDYNIPMFTFTVRDGAGEYLQSDFIYIGVAENALPKDRRSGGEGVNKGLFCVHYMENPNEVLFSSYNGTYNVKSETYGSVWGF